MSPYCCRRWRPDGYTEGQSDLSNDISKQHAPLSRALSQLGYWHKFKFKFKIFASSKMSAYLSVLSGSRFKPKLGECYSKNCLHPEHDNVMPTVKLVNDVNLSGGTRYTNRRKHMTN